MQDDIVSEVMPNLLRFASIVAFVVAGLIAVSALVGQIILLPMTLIPLSAGIGILHRRVWSAYGYALYLFAQLLFTPLLIIRTAKSTTSVAETVVSVGMTLALGVLFLLAGRSLAAAGSQRGWAFPWIALAVASTVPLLFVQAFVIPSGGMEDTLLIGDRVLVRSFPKPSVTSGDVIVFRYPVDRRQVFVKRVIGLPGDRIRISGKVVYRNGAALNEPYAIHKTDYTDSYRDNFPSESNAQVAVAAREMLVRNVAHGEVVVPERSYFVLGDNRDNSLDSRYWGFVDFNDFIGRPLVIYDSEDQPPEMLMNGKFSGRRRVRWERVFRIL